MKKVLVSLAIVAITIFGAPGLAAAADFNVSTVGFAYSINGLPNFPTLTLARGKTYTFVNADGSGFVHPFGIMDFPTTQGGQLYSAGVSGDAPLVNGTMTFTVPANAPTTLYYQCQIHEFMIGQINVISAGPPKSVAGTAAPALNDTARGILFLGLAFFGSAGVGRALQRRKQMV